MTDRTMRPGDIVLVTSESDDQGARGILRKQHEIVIGRVRRFWIVRFDDGHEGAYEPWELRVVEASNHERT